MKGKKNKKKSHYVPLIKLMFMIFVGRNRDTLIKSPLLLSVLQPVAALRRFTVCDRDT